MSKLIYVLDDCHVVREHLPALLMLDLYDIEIKVFSTGTALLDAVEEERPSVILCDFYLKGSTSVHIIQDIRKTNSESLIIVISGSDEQIVTRQSLQAGANNVCVKGDYSRVVRMIKNHFRIRARTTGDVLNKALSEFKIKATVDHIAKDIAKGDTDVRELQCKVDELQEKCIKLELLAVNK